MTDLQKRMIETLQLGGLSERTQETCVRALRQRAPRISQMTLAIQCQSSAVEVLLQYFRSPNVRRQRRAEAMGAQHTTLIGASAGRRGYAAASPGSSQPGNTKMPG